MKNTDLPLSIASTDDSNHDETISLMELAEKIGDSRIKIDTVRKRISRIIASNKIDFTETGNSKQIAIKDIPKIEHIYHSKFKDDKLLKRTKISSENDELQQKIEKKNKLIHELQLKVSEHIKEIDNLNLQINEYKQQIREKDGQIKDLSEKIAEAFHHSQELDFAQLKLDYQRKISEESGKVESVGRKLSYSQQQIIDLQKVLNDKTVDISERDINITKLESQLREQKSVSDAQLKEQKYKLMNRSLIDRIRNKDSTKEPD